MNRILFLYISLWSTGILASELQESQKVPSETMSLVNRLTNEGIEIAGQQIKLSPIWLADGLTADEQSEVTNRIAGRLRERFYRDTIAAPFEANISSIKEGNRRVGYVVDFGFVVYGSLEELTDKNNESLRSTFANESDMKIEEVTGELLRSVGITGIEVSNTPRLIHAEFTLLDKVFVSAVIRTFMEKSDESVTVAWELDDRFSENEGIANYWKFTEANETANTSAYTGFAGHAKVTKLKEKTGALFVEYHYAFAEPTEWSEKKVSLRAKLSVVLQEAIRKSRRQIHKMSGR